MNNVCALVRRISLSPEDLGSRNHICSYVCYARHVAHVAWVQPHDIISYHIISEYETITWGWFLCSHAGEVGCGTDAVQTRYRPSFSNIWEIAFLRREWKRLGMAVAVCFLEKRWLGEWRKEGTLVLVMEEGWVAGRVSISAPYILFLLLLHSLSHTTYISIHNHHLYYAPHRPDDWVWRDGCMQSLKLFNRRISQAKWWRAACRPFVLYVYLSVLWSSVGWLIILSKSVAHIYANRETYNFSSI